MSASRQDLSASAWITQHETPPRTALFNDAVERGPLYGVG
jgi:hypothetical protein